MTPATIVKVHVRQLVFTGRKRISPPNQTSQENKFYSTLRLKTTALGHSQTFNCDFNSSALGQMQTANARQVLNAGPEETHHLYHGKATADDQANQEMRRFDTGHYVRIGPVGNRIGKVAFVRGRRMLDSLKIYARSKMQ